jgi:hypothetical protein
MPFKHDGRVGSDPKWWLPAGSRLWLQTLVDLASDVQLEQMKDKSGYLDCFGLNGELKMSPLFYQKHPFETSFRTSKKTQLPHLVTLKL